jgi:hypothetical protein
VVSAQNGTRMEHGPAGTAASWSSVVPRHRALWPRSAPRKKEEASQPPGCRPRVTDPGRPATGVYLRLEVRRSVRTPSGRSYMLELPASIQPIWDGGTRTAVNSHGAVIHLRQL